MFSTSALLADGCTQASKLSLKAFNILLWLATWPCKLQFKSPWHKRKLEHISFQRQIYFRAVHNVSNLTRSIVDFSVSLRPLISGYL